MYICVCVCVQVFQGGWDGVGRSQALGGKVQQSNLTGSPLPPTHLISHDCHMTPDAGDAGRREEEAAGSEGTSAGGSGDRDQNPGPHSPGPQCQYRSDGQGGVPGEEAGEPSETGSQGVAQEILHRQHAGVHYGAEPRE